MSDERVKVTVEGDADDLRRALKSAAADLKGFGREVEATNARVRRADSDNRRMVGGFEDIGAQATKAAASLVRFALKAEELKVAAAATIALATNLKDLAAVGPAAAQGMTAAAQAIGVTKLATAGLSDALGAATTALNSNHKAAFLAYRGGSTEAKAYRDELKKLAPEQRVFVDQLVRMEPLVKRLQASAAKGLLPGAGEGISKAAQNFGVLQKVVTETSEVLGRNASRAGDFLGSKQFGKDLAAVGESNALVIDRMARATINLAGAAEDLIVSARPLTEWLSLSALRLSRLVEQEVAAARQTGELTDWFERAHQKIDRLATITESLARGLDAVVTAATPLGDDLLESIDGAATRWADWMTSVEGQETLKEFFDSARPVIAEVGDLVVSLAETFRDLAGSGGPLSLFLHLLTEISDDVRWLIENVPGIGTAIVGMAAAASIYKALGIASSISGLKTMTKLVKDLRGAAITTGVVEGAAGAGGAGGAAAAAGAGGSAIGSLLKNGARGAIAGAGSDVAIAALPLAMIKLTEKDWKLDKLTSELDQIADAPEGSSRMKQLVELEKGLRAAVAAGDPAKLRRISAEIATIGQTAHGVVNQHNFEMLTADVNAFADAKAWGQSKHAIDAASANFQSLRDTGHANLTNLRTTTEANMLEIARTVDVHSAQGKAALAANFQAAAAAVQTSMDAGVISSKTGLAEIEKLMEAALGQYGFSKSEAANIIKTGDTQGNAGREGGAVRALAPGQTRTPTGTTYAVNKRATGGMASPYGGSSRDDHVLLDPTGRPVAAMSGTEGILNNPQMGVVDGALAATAAMGLQPYGGLGALWGSGMRHFAGGGAITAPTVGGGGSVGAVVQAGLNRVTAAANTSLDGVGFSGSGGSGSGGGGGGGGPVPKGSVRSWIIAGLRLAGQPVTAANVAMEYGLAMKESGGNPSIANTTDINAQHGDPSIGLMQTTGSTFRSYMVPGHGNIRNPIDNVAASLRYQVARYGHLIGFSPYAKGGLLRRFAGGGSLNRASGTGSAITGKEHGVAKRQVTKHKLGKGPAKGLDLGITTGIVDSILGTHGELDLAELRADATSEQSLITLPDGSQVRDEAGIAQHLVELTGLMGIRDRAAQALQAELVTAQSALTLLKRKVADELAKIAAIRVKVKTNTARIASLKDQLTAEGRKKKGGDKNVKNRLTDQIGALSSENTSLNQQLSKLTGTLSTDQGKLPDLENMLKPSGLAYDIVANQLERGKLASEYSDWSGTVAPAAPSSSPTGDNGLADLRLGQANALLTSAAVQRGGFDVLEGFKPLLGMRLVGSFAHGTDRVRETGLALVHKDEQIVPDARGPYGSQLGGRGGQPLEVRVTVQTARGEVLKIVRTEIDSRAGGVANRQIAQSARAILAAPGGR